MSDLRPRVVAFDLSLTATGWATVSPGEPPRFGRFIPPRNAKGCERMAYLAGRIAGLIIEERADLAAMEGPSYGSASTKMFHESAGLWWQVRMRLYRESVVSVVISPSSVKKYATGKGSAEKTLVAMEAARRFRDNAPRSTDEADALWLAAMCAERYGFPLLDLPAAHREAIYAIVPKSKTSPAHPAIDWPQLEEFHAA